MRTWTFRRKATERARLTRLAASLLQYRSTSRADYARFLRAYLVGTARNPQEWRNRFRELARSARAYKRRALKRKDAKLDGYAG